MSALPVVGKAHEAGPGSDFVWFVYGSSLDAPALAAWCAEHGYTPPDLSRGTPARLDGFRLAFDVASRFWGGAVADLAEAPGAQVEGLALPMPGTARAFVEHKEGVVSGLFAPAEVAVTPLRGGAPIPAVAFRAAAGRRLAAEAPPAPAFLEALLRGARARGLSPGWIAALEGLRR